MEDGVVVSGVSDPDDHCEEKVGEMQRVQQVLVAIDNKELLEVVFQLPVLCCQLGEEPVELEHDHKGEVRQDRQTRDEWVLVVDVVSFNLIQDGPPNQRGDDAESTH